MQVHWALTSDESTASERLMALEFLDVFSGVGTIDITGVDPHGHGSASLDLEGFGLDADMRFELELYRNLAAIEERTGVETGVSSRVENAWGQ